MAPEIVLQFALATMLPVVATIVFFLLQRKTRFGGLGFWPQQIIIGIVFGAIAVFGTEFGINAYGATMNVRDAAPIVSGLLFGGPSGIIAGLIGGIERWFSVLWGRGEFTQVGCSIATVAVGFYAAALRKFMFDGKKPSWIMALAIGVVAEVLHLTLIFVTNMDAMKQAITVVRACTMPMLLCNGLSVMLSVVAAMLLCGESLYKAPEERAISQTVQTSMFVAVLVAFVATSAFTFVLQTSLSSQQVAELLRINIDDVRTDIEETSDANLLATTRKAAERIGSVKAAKTISLKDLAHELGVSEIDVIDETEKIVASTYADFVGYDMSSGEQSREFIPLLDGTHTEYVQDYQPMSYDQNVMRKYAGVAIEGGFVQTSYNEQEFQAQIGSQIAGMTSNRHVGESGSVLICNARGQVVSSLNNEADGSLQDSELGSAVKASAPNTVFKSAYGDVSVYGMYTRTEAYLIIAIIPQAEAEFSRNTAILVSSFMEILVFAALFAVIYYLIKRLVVDNIRRINSTLGEITAGDLEASVDVRSNEEFASLSDDINETVAALKRAIAETAARIDAELVYARTIQRSALPMVFQTYPPHYDYQIYASMDAAKEVGGDFYDLYLLDDDHLVFLIADVSGKGIPAAMFMMQAKTILKSLAEAGLEPNEVLMHANDELCANNEAEMFVTVWMGILDLRTGDVRFVNAGHNPPVIAHAGEKFSFHVVRPNLVLAGMEGIPYKQHELKLLPGDTIFLYTDGVTEATDLNDELFGEDRLLASLDARESQSVESICRGVHGDVEAFVGEAPQFDDITVLALRYVGRKDNDEA